MAAAQPSPPQGGPLAGHTPGRRSKRICCVQSPTAPTRHPTAGDGRPKVRARGHTPTPAFLTLPEGQGGKDRRGAPRTDREERTRSLGTPVPRPARLRPGPGEHNHTTSISRAKVGGRGGKAQARTVTGGARFKPHRQPPPRLPTTSHLRRGRPTTPGGERLTRGTEPTGRGVVPATTGCPQRGAQGQRPTPPRPTALGSPRHGTTSWVGQTRHTGPGAQAQAGGSSGKGRTRHQLAAHRPRAPRASRDPKSSVADTKRDRVSTYLVAKKTYFG